MMKKKILSVQQICIEQNSSSTTLTSGDGLTQTYACTDCCQSDLCNSKGCGEPGRKTFQKLWIILVLQDFRCMYLFQIHYLRKSDYQYIYLYKSKMSARLKNIWQILNYTYIQRMHLSGFFFYYFKLSFEADILKKITYES